MTHSIASQQAREKRGMCALSWGRISAAWQTVPSPLLSESMRIKSSNSRAVILSTGLAYHHHEQHAAFSRLVAPWPGRSMYVGIAIGNTLSFVVQKKHEIILNSVLLLNSRGCGV